MRFPNDELPLEIGQAEPSSEGTESDERSYISSVSAVGFTAGLSFRVLLAGRDIASRPSGKSCLTFHR